MLAVVVLVRFHHPHGGITRVVERTVMAAATETIEAIDQHHIQLRDMAGQRLDVTRQVAAGRIDLAAGETALPGFLGCFIGTRALGEHPRGMSVGDAVDATAVADHVVVEHADDPPAVRLRVFGQDATAVQALFFAPQRRIDDRAMEPLLAEHAGGLQCTGDAAGIVVGAGRIAGGIHDIADT